jgi:hypothetical protein
MRRVMRRLGWTVEKRDRSDERTRFGRTERTVHRGTRCLINGTAATHTGCQQRTLGRESHVYRQIARSLISVGQGSRSDLTFVPRRCSRPRDLAAFQDVSSRGGMVPQATAIGRR